MNQFPTQHKFYYNNSSGLSTVIRDSHQLGLCYRTLEPTPSALPWEDGSYRPPCWRWSSSAWWLQRCAAPESATYCARPWWSKHQRCACRKICTHSMSQQPRSSFKHIKGWRKRAGKRFPESETQTGRDASHDDTLLSGFWGFSLFVHLYRLTECRWELCSRWSTCVQMEGVCAGSPGLLLGGWPFWSPFPRWAWPASSELSPDTNRKG